MWLVGEDISTYTPPYYQKEILSNSWVVDMNLLKQKQNSTFTAEMSVQENTMLNVNTACKFIFMEFDKFLC